MLHCEFVPDDTHFPKGKVLYQYFPERVPEYDVDEIYRGPQVYLCRHGHSEFNKAFEEDFKAGEGVKT